jgi:hypothetical protein
MGGTFVGDFEGGRRESDGQLVADGFGYAHAGEGSRAAG